MEATITCCFSTPHPALGGPATPGGVTFPSSAHLLACSALTFKGRVPRGMYRSVCFLLTVRVCALWKGGRACLYNTDCAGASGKHWFVVAWVIE